MTNGYQVFHFVREKDEQGEYCYLRPVSGELAKVFANETEVMELLADIKAGKETLPGEFVILNVKTL